MTVETVIPKTENGAGEGRWARALRRVDAKARDAWGFEGDPVWPGKIDDLKAGTLVLECAGRRKRGSSKLMLLWLLDADGSWSELAQSDEESWALELRDVAREALEAT